MKDVSSVLATGNILFESDGNSENLNKTGKNHFPSIFNTNILFLKTDEEVGNVLENSPFEKDKNLHIYSFICNSGDENLFANNF